MASYLGPPSIHIYFSGKPAGFDRGPLEVMSIADDNKLIERLKVAIGLANLVMHLADYLF